MLLLLCGKCHHSLIPRFEESGNETSILFKAQDPGNETSFIALFNAQDLYIAVHSLLGESGDTWSGSIPRPKPGSW